MQCSFGLRTSLRLLIKKKKTLSSKRRSISLFSQRQKVKLQKEACTVTDRRLFTSQKLQRNGKHYQKLLNSYNNLQVSWKIVLLSVETENE